MIPKAWRGAGRFLGSPRLALWLLAIAGAWSAAATAIPQGDLTNQKVASWATAHSLVEPAVRAIGLHQAFTSLVFTVCVLALGLCTGVCAWRRTKAAITRGRALRDAALTDERTLVEGPVFAVQCDPALSASDVMMVASVTLKRLGVRTKRRDGMLTAVSPSWTAWGSPVFHWALVGLILALLFGTLQRSEGLIGVPLGQTKTDAPASYTELHAGPLHNWSWEGRSIRVDEFYLGLQSGGIDRGPTPVVSVLDAAGNVIKSQPVYPNNPLTTGTLTIHPFSYGLVAGIAHLDASGVETGARRYVLVDFSQTATEGTVPASGLAVYDSAGKIQLKVTVTVPLAGTPGHFDEALPKKPTARVIVTSVDGTRVAEGVLSPGENLALPAGGSLHLGYVSYYASLSVVDDWSIPLLYAALSIALIGLTVTVAARQQAVLATTVDGPDGVGLAVSVRLWRNASTSRGEIESELTAALGGRNREDTL